MSILRYSLITWPVHHYSRRKYYQRHEEYIEKRKRVDGKYWAVPFDQLSEESKRMWENLLWWPPWKYNDIVGFLEVGMDIGDHMTADIFLKRKYLPKNHPGKRSGNREKTNDVLYFCEVSKIPVRGRENKSYIETLAKLLREANKIVKKRNRYFEIFIPSFNKDCYDLARAHKQLKEGIKYE